MEIKKIQKNKEMYMDLLLLGDEQANMIKKYLYRGELFALYDDDLKTVSVVTKEKDKIYEIKNIKTGAMGSIWWNIYLDIIKTSVIYYSLVQEIILKQYHFTKNAGSPIRTL
jgi:hypothetical protein